jgi:predicted nucleic acid-binding protein
VKTRRLLDSFALIAFLAREAGYETVRTLLREAEASRDFLLMNEINVGEVYYLTAKDRSPRQAEEALHLLEALPIRLLGNTFPQVLEAARLMAQLPISYADAFALATAIREQAVLVTGDREFRTASDLVEIQWI